jgi:hypothetical protein
MVKGRRGAERAGEGASGHLASLLGGGALFIAAAVTAGAYLLRKRGYAPKAGAPKPPAAAFVPGPTRPDELEGWGVSWRVAVLAGAGVFIFIAATLGGAHVFYEHAGAPTVETRRAARFPGPTLNARLDRDPGWSFALTPQQIHDPGRQVRAAMTAVAEGGNAVYDAPGRKP